MFDERPYEGRFLVFGRVLNEGNTGVNECSVILIKREFNLFSLPLIARTFRESPVARTDSSGDFSFFFEPLESNNIWLYFEAQGYVPRFIDIDDLFRGPLYRRPPNNPLNISVVLERQVISKDTVVQEMDDSDETQVPDQEEW
ncbi:MAG: hypothetical protein U9O82_00230 [Thermodesulfobacteriota bacterium]|nr:hypothetical protein [Thermodesulfobacteriota bacterium]